MQRIKRNCARPQDFREQSKILVNKCREKKYPRTLVKAPYNRADKLTQEDCVKPRTKNMTLKAIKTQRLSNVCSLQDTIRITTWLIRLCQNTGMFLRMIPILKKYQINLDCSSTNVIYVINCTCGLQYVGRTTQPLCMRVNNHRFYIQRGYYKHSVSRHAANQGCKIEDFNITPVEQIHKNTRNIIHCPSERCSGFIS